MAAKGLGRKIDTMLAEQKKVAEVRNFLDKIYNGSMAVKKILIHSPMKN